MKKVNTKIIKNNETIELIQKINLFLTNFENLAEDYNLDENSVDDIYELLFSNTMEIFFQNNLHELKILFNYHHNIFNEILESITYEDICDIIKKYLMISSDNNEKTLKYDITQNLLKINISFIKKKIYICAPRLLLTSKSVLMDMMFEEETATKYLIEAIDWIKLKENMV
jgi:septum formation topological specificity factor MinE